MFTGIYSGPVVFEAAQRPTYGEARAHILAGIAARLGKPVEQLRGWEDYDPITVDAAAYHLSRGETGVRWAGD